MACQNCHCSCICRPRADAFLASPSKEEERPFSRPGRLIEQQYDQLVSLTPEHRYWFRPLIYVLLGSGHLARCNMPISVARN